MGSLLVLVLVLILVACSFSIVIVVVVLLLSVIYILYILIVAIAKVLYTTISYYFKSFIQPLCLCTAKCNASNVLLAPEINKSSYTNRTKFSYWKLELPY